MASSSLALAAVAAGCQQASGQQSSEESQVAVTQQAQLEEVKDLAKMCGLDVDCEAGGVAEGRASISGVPSVDAFFAAVINFQNKADVVSSGIKGELDAIRGDFGIAATANLGAEIKAQANLYVDGGLEIVAEPARCP